MAQTLTVLPAVSNPVKVTDGATLSGDVAAIQNMDNRDVRALQVLSKIYQLAAAGGANYKSNFAQLRIDATTFMNAGGFGIPVPPAVDKLQRVGAVIDWNAAYAVDATIGTDVNALVVLMGGLRITPEATLYQFYLFLKYKLAL